MVPTHWLAPPAICTSYVGDSYSDSSSLGHQRDIAEMMECDFHPGLDRSLDSKPGRYYSYHLHCTGEKLTHHTLKQFVWGQRAGEKRRWDVNAISLTAEPTWETGNHVSTVEKRSIVTVIPGVALANGEDVLLFSFRLSLMLSYYLNSHDMNRYLQRKTYSMDIK